MSNLLRFQVFDPVLLEDRKWRVIFLSFLRASASLFDVFGLAVLSFMMSGMVDGYFPDPAGLGFWYFGDPVSRGSLIAVSLVMVGSLSLKNIIAFLVSMQLRNEASLIQTRLAKRILEDSIFKATHGDLSDSDFSKKQMTLSQSLSFWSRIEIIAKPTLIGEMVNIALLVTAIALSDLEVFFILLFAAGFVFISLRFLVNPRILRNAKTSQSANRLLTKYLLAHNSLLQEIATSRTSKQWTDFIGSQVWRLSRSQGSLALWNGIPRAYFEVAAISGFALIVALAVSGDNFLGNLGSLAFVGAGMLRIVGSLVPIQNSVNVITESKSRSKDARNAILSIEKTKLVGAPARRVNSKTVESIVKDARAGVYLLRGPSGAGKTSLMRQVIHAFPPGTKVGYLSQSPHLISWSFAANISLDPLANDVLEVQAASDSKLWASMKISEISASWDRQLLDVKGSPVLSTGEIQRLGILRAFFGPQDVVVLDEPTSSLDDDTSLKLADYISGLSGIKIVIASHDEGFMAKLDKLAEWSIKPSGPEQQSHN